MEESKNLGYQNENPDKNLNKEPLEKKNKESEPILMSNNELDEDKNSKISSTEDTTDDVNNKILKVKTFEDNKKAQVIAEANENIENNKLNIAEPSSATIANKTVKNIDNCSIEKAKDKISGDNKKEDPNLKSNEKIDYRNLEKINSETIKEKIPEGNKNNVSDPNSVTAKNIDKVNKLEAIEKNLGENKKVNLTTKTNENADIKNSKEISTTVSVKAKPKPTKEPPIEKKPFLEFINDYLIPEIKNEFIRKGKEVNKINLQKTHRPIAEDICWVIYCEINDTCNFWLSFEKDDITSLKSFSLCKNYEKPSIIESFLIDEKKITLKLIISRILQRLNGQKLIGAN
tara:strand:- start:1 stop:1035 length:1035 start_codon:yes stop_codon:yes gene_type:complete